MVTVPMLMDWVRSLSDTINNQSFFPDFIKWIFAAPTQPEERETVLEPGTILVCESTLEAAGIETDIPVMVISKDRSLPASADIRTNALYVQTSLSKLAFAAQLQKKINSIQNWEHDLDRISAERGTYQDMLNISRDILGNLITISDSTYHLVAYTPDMPTDDPRTLELIKKGVHGSAAIEIFRKTNAFTKWAKQKKTHYSPHGVTQYPSMNHVFTSNGAYFIQMVMTCDNVACTPGLQDTFEILVTHIKSHIRRCQNSQADFSSKGASFLANLLDGKALAPEVISQRARDIGVPEKGPFRLFAIKNKRKSSENLGYLAHAISTSVPGCFIVQSDSLVYAIICLDTAKPSSLNDVERAISALVDFNYVDVSISGQIPFLKDLYMGAKQTKVAFRYGKDRPELIYGGNVRPDPLFRFDDCLFDYLLFADKRDREFLQFCLDVSPLALIKQGRQKNPSDFTVLRLYLKLECNTTLTAETLGVHRNTVLNRIDSISKKSHINLQDPKARINLMVLYHLSDYLSVS